jgi:hypothetical protein
MKRILLAVSALAFALPAFATSQEPCTVTRIDPKSSNPKADSKSQIVPRREAERMQREMVLKSGEAVVITCPVSPVKK